MGTIHQLLQLVKAADLAPDAVQDILVEGAHNDFYYFELPQDFIPAASAVALDKMVEAWHRTDPHCDIVPCEACGHLRQVAQHAHVKSLSAASQGRLLVLSSTHQAHQTITDLVLGSNSSTGSSSSSSSTVEKADMVHKALKYAVESFWYGALNTLLKANMLRLLQHPVAQQLLPEAAQGLVLLAKKKQHVWALKAFLEHLPAARMVPEEVVEALLHSSLLGELEDDDDYQAISITVQDLLQQLPGALHLPGEAMQRLIDTAMKKPEPVSFQLLLDHCAAIPVSLSVGYLGKLISALLWHRPWHLWELVLVLLQCRPLEEWEGLPGEVLKQLVRNALGSDLDQQFVFEYCQPISEEICMLVMRLPGACSCREALRSQKRGFGTCLG